MVRLMPVHLTFNDTSLTQRQIILAIYYTLADIVLLGQCFYYRGFTFRDPRPDKEPTVEDGAATERSALLPPNGHARPSDAEPGRSHSVSSFRDRFASAGELLSPANPMHPVPKTSRPATTTTRSGTRQLVQKILFNLTAVLVVVAAGIAGYYLSASSTNSGGASEPEQEDVLHFSPGGQAFGYLCALLYLGSRLPQLLLNYRRKSTEGLNALFFLFACIGNLTYVLSIFAFDPICHGGRRGKDCHTGEAGRIYGRYILVNLSWILGSLGTLFLDMGVFAQFFMYRKVEEDEWEQAVVDDVPRLEGAEERGRSE